MITATEAAQTASDSWPRPLDPAQVLARAEDAVVRRREAELSELLACGDRADLHAADPREDPGHSPVRGGEQLVQLGGDGTPKVRDLALLELGIALARHPLAVRAMTADLLDLRHRLPRTWRHVMDGQAEAWLARKVASLSRGVPAHSVGAVDAAVAAAIIGVAPSRLLEIAAAAVIAADPVGHRAQVARERARRVVGLTRSDETGLRTLIARVTAGDAVHLDAVSTASPTSSPPTVSPTAVLRWVATGRARRRWAGWPVPPSSGSCSPATDWGTTTGRSPGRSPCPPMS